MDKQNLINKQSKDRLKIEAKKRIRTTMVGAIASIERHFGHLWGYDEPNKTPQEQEMLQVFKDLRTEIFDKGNDQIKFVESEIDKYDVEWKKFHISIPIQRIKGRKNDE